jgi:hypothetical protein
MYYKVWREGGREKERERGKGEQTMKGQLALGQGHRSRVTSAHELLDSIFPILKIILVLCRSNALCTCLLIILVFLSSSQ